MAIRIMYVYIAIMPMCTENETRLCKCAVMITGTVYFEITE